VTRSSESAGAGVSGRARRDTGDRNGAMSTGQGADRRHRAAVTAQGKYRVP